MFSLTLPSTLSCPQTSLKRVLMSSGKYTSTPPRERSQNKPMNWNAMKKNAKPSCRAYGIARNSAIGSWKMAMAAERW